MIRRALGWALYLLTDYRQARRGAASTTAASTTTDSTTTASTSAASTTTDSTTTDSTTTASTTTASTTTDSTSAALPPSVDEIAKFLVGLLKVSPLIVRKREGRIWVLIQMFPDPPIRGIRPPMYWREEGRPGEFSTEFVGDYDVLVATLNAAPQSCGLIIYQPATNLRLP